MFVLSTRMNVLAFSLANVFFSFVVGCFLLFLGAYGRFSGALPAGNPYAADTADDDGPRPSIEAPAPMCRRSAASGQWTATGETEASRRTPSAALSAARRRASSR